jgi:hypothetical protein
VENSFFHVVELEAGSEHAAERRAGWRASTLLSAKRNDTYKTKADLKIGLYDFGLLTSTFEPISAGPPGRAWDPIPACRGSS